MKYSEEELNIINEKRADLRKKPAWLSDDLGSLLFAFQNHQ